MNGLFRSSVTLVAEQQHPSWIQNPSSSVNGYRSYVRAGATNSSIFNLDDLNDSEIADLQMFLALRKRQRRTLDAELATANASVIKNIEVPVTTPGETQSNHHQHHGTTSSAPPGGMIIKSTQIRHEPNQQIDGSRTNQSQPQGGNLKRMYQCRHCPKLLSSSSNRSRHEREQHPTDSALPNNHQGSGRVSGHKRNSTVAELNTISEELTLNNPVGIRKK